jgi:hypothetical protein
MTKRPTLTGFAEACFKTDAALVEALEKAARIPLSAEEVEQQRVSFIMGSLSADSSMSKEKVQEILAQQMGR